MDDYFTLENAIEIQDQHLKEWKSVLKPEVYNLVQFIVKNKNEGITNPFHICRGVDIDTIVKNQMIKDHDKRRENKETTGKGIQTQR